MSSNSIGSSSLAPAAARADGSSVSGAAGDESSPSPNSAHAAALGIGSEASSLSTLAGAGNSQTAARQRAQALEIAQTSLPIATVALRSEDLLSEAVDSGVLSAGAGQALARGVDVAVEEFSRSLQEMETKTKEAMDLYQTQTQDINDVLVTGGLEAMKRALAGELDDETARGFEVALGYADQLLPHLEATLQTLVRVQTEFVNGKFQGYERVVQVLFDARMKEIDLLSAEFDTLSKVEDHQLEQNLKVRAQQLSEQQQQFDQIMALADKNSEEAQREFDDYLAKKAQEDLHTREVKAQADRAKKDGDDREIADRKITTDKTLREDDRASTERIELARIAAEKAARIAQAEASRPRGGGKKCIVM